MEDSGKGQGISLIKRWFQISPHSRVVVSQAGSPELGCSLKGLLYKKVREGLPGRAGSPPLLPYYMINLVDQRTLLYIYAENYHFVKWCLLLYC